MESEKYILELGFKKEKNDPNFLYSKPLCSEYECLEKGIRQMPELLIASVKSGDSQFCIYTGENFIWLKSETVKEAIEFCKNISHFELN